MTAALIVLVVIFVIIGIAAPVIFWQVRKIFRQQKNFERGLKMVPLLMHIPPLSEDTDANGRDVRDVLDENISKAQVIYNIIASTMQKGFKSKFYGQRHFSFEIVGHKGFVNYYAAVPVVLVDVVKQAVISAYPSARLEEVAEHNIFSPVGKISGTIGGELTLKESFAYPIATYQDLKRDAMQSILNAMSTLDKEDGVGIQILMRPAPNDWRKSAASHATKKRKGKDKKKSGGDRGIAWLRQLFTALAKPPEDKGSADKPELSNLDQNTVDSIDEKTRYPGYEVLIRVVASSNISQRAQAVLNSVVASFSLFDAPGRNGFKYTPAKDIEQFVTAYIMRFFPQEINQNILNSVELATIFHFPDQKNIPTTQLERQQSKQTDGPRNISEEGLLLGYNVFRGVKKPIRLNIEDRRRHIYSVGQTGTGKSQLLENMALQDMLAGRGFAFVDPHGDTVERLMAMVPRERTEDVIYFNPSDTDYPMGLNLFEASSPEQRDFLIQEAINMLYKLYDPQHQGIMGPRYEHLFRNTALTLMSDPGGASFIDIPKIFTDNAYAKQKLKHVTDPTVLDFWNKEMANTTEYHKSEVTGWFVSKFGAFLGNEMMRNVIGQTKSSFNLRDIMDNKKILLVNLSKGRTGELNSKLLGMVFVMKFQVAAMSRVDTPEDERQDFSLYVDEFQNFATDSFATILSEARKFHLNLIVANQFTTQLTDEIRDAVFGNVGSIISFRVGADADAEVLSKKFAPIFDREDILRIPNYNTVTQILIGGVPTQPFSMATLPPLGTPNPQLSTALKQLSSAKFGKPKAVVAAEIFDRLTTKPEPPKPGFSSGNPFATTTPAGAAAPAFGGGSPNQLRPSAGVTPAGPASTAPGSSSFLDDWLAKRRTTSPVSPSSAAGPAALPFGSNSGSDSAAAVPAATSNPFGAAPAGQLAAPTGASLPPDPFGLSSPTSPAASAAPIPSNQPPLQPFQGAPAPVFTSTPNANISSDQADQQEVNDIAQELRQSLNAAPPNTPHQGEIAINKTDDATSTAPDEDTIYIDRDGNFHPSDAQPSAK